MSWLEFAPLDTDALAAQWRAAAPFPHVQVESLISDKALSALRYGVSAEPHWPNRSELYEMMASGDEVTNRMLGRFATAIRAPEFMAAVTAITGKSVSSVQVRSYVYLEGSYLLPHTDLGDGSERRVAWIFYLSERTACEGGELELFGEPPTLIEPIANRLVLMDVSDDSLHQVREVTRGARISLAGWFMA